MDDLFAHGLELRKWQEKYRDSTQDYPADYDHNTVVEGQTSESSWFADQHEIALRRFKEYLNLLPKAVLPPLSVWTCFVSVDTYRTERKRHRQ